jgi:hypothetical protein
MKQSRTQKKPKVMTMHGKVFPRTEIVLPRTDKVFPRTIFILFYYQNGFPGALFQFLFKIIDLPNRTLIFLRDINVFPFERKTLLLDAIDLKKELR